MVLHEHTHWTAGSDGGGDRMEMLGVMGGSITTTTTSQSGSHQHHNTVFVSSSYHKDNVLSTVSTGHHALNRRIFELIHSRQSEQGSSSSVPPKVHDDLNKTLDLRKAYSAPNDDDKPELTMNMNMNRTLKLIGIPSQKDDVIVDIGNLQKMGQQNFKKSKARRRSKSEDVHQKEEEEGDALETPKLTKHASSRSLLDEIGRFASIFSQNRSSKNSISFSSKSKSKSNTNNSLKSVKSNKSNKSSKSNQSQKSSKSHRRRATMPSMELNGTNGVNSTDPMHFDDAANDEQGDIVNMLSVLVQHGFYSKKNLNSVQQLTHYNVK